VGLNALKSLNLTNGYPNNKNNKNNNKVKSKPLELFELAGKNTNESKEGARQCIRLFQKCDPNPQCWTSHLKIWQILLPLGPDRIQFRAFLAFPLTIFFVFF
jgi:hypothetical protein